MTAPAHESLEAPPDATPHPSNRTHALADRIPSWLLAVAGIALTALSANRMGVALAGWIAPVPLGILSTRLRGWRGRLVLYGTCLAGIALATLKIVSPPVTVAFALLFAVPMGGMTWLTLVAWDSIQRRAGPAWGLYAFAALSALADFAGYALSPLGAWATSTASQMDDLPLLQVASLGGLALVGLVMALPIGAAIGIAVAPPDRRPWRHALAAAGVAVLAHGWGAARLDAADQGTRTVRVAVVTVDLPEPLSSLDDLRGNVETLFARSELAARREAQIVVWNEAATLIDRAEEPALVERGIAFARSHGVDLVMAYGVVLSRNPFRIDNVFTWVGARGEVLERYRKHFLPPGEPAIAGTEPVRVHRRPWGAAAGAICYDYDFPALAREQARRGAALVVLPSSDWRGIDPQHTLMARVRAIEGGLSVVRAVRAATSMAFDPYGRVRASMPAWEEHEHVMLATVPVVRVPTLYAAAGDWPAAVAAIVALAAAVALRRSRAAARVFDN